MSDIDPAVLNIFAVERERYAGLGLGSSAPPRRARTVAEIHADMATRRIDTWAQAFGGVFRLFLPMPLLTQLEAMHGAVGLLYGGLPDGARSALGKVTAVAAARDVVQLALSGGGQGVLAGESVPVSGWIAARLVATLDDAPLAETWRLARAALEARLLGRSATKDETAQWTLDDQNAPMIPAWAGLAA